MRAGRGLALEGGAKGRVRDGGVPTKGKPAARLNDTSGSYRNGESVTKGSRDDRGRGPRKDAGASGKGDLGKGFKGEQSTGKPSRTPPTVAERGGLDVDSSLKRHNIEGYEPRHTSKTR